MVFRSKIFRRKKKEKVPKIEERPRLRLPKNRETKALGYNVGREKSIVERRRVEDTKRAMTRIRREATLKRKEFDKSIVNDSEEETPATEDETDKEDIEKEGEVVMENNLRTLKERTTSSEYKRIKDNKIEIDGHEIDLDKLPPNLRRLLIAGILERPNFD